MMKKLWLAAVLILTLGFGTVGIMAAEPAVSPEAVVDDADLLSADEESSLKGKADLLEETYHMDAAIVTLTDMNGTDAQLAADDIFQNNGYGTGEGRDGILLMVSMQNRTWAITTHGSAIDLFTDFRLDEIGDRITPYLSEAQYYEAFDVFLQDVEFYLNDSTQGQDASLLPGTANALTPKDQESEGEVPVGEADSSRTSGAGEQAKQPVTPGTKAAESTESDKVQTSRYPLKNMLVMSVIGGLLAAIFATQNLKSKAKNVKEKKDAADYMHSKGYEMIGKRDTFLYSNVDKTERPDSNRRDDQRRNNTRHEPRRGDYHSTTTTHVDRNGERHGGTKGKF